MTTERKVSVREARRITGLSITRLYVLLWSDQLPGASKLGNLWQIPVIALKPWTKN